MSAAKGDAGIFVDNDPATERERRAMDPIRPDFPNPSVPEPNVNGRPARLDSRAVYTAMPDRPGLVRRLSVRILGALRRCILGRSSWDYLKQYTGSDAYWDNALAAERGWPEQQVLKPEPDHARNSAAETALTDHVDSRAGPNGH